MADKKLTRNTEDKILGGVCSGLAEYYGHDTTLVRLGFALFTLLWGIGLLVYLIMWLVDPKKENEESE